MKHLLVYEAFESDIISNIIKHVGKKIGKKNINDFIKSLKRIQSIYDIPIDKIKTEDLKYLPAKKVLETQPDDDTVYYNEYKIKNINFWFSIENGYEVTTGIGDGKFEEVLTLSKFTTSELDYIKENLNITKGELTPVIDYKDVKHGDMVIGYFGRSMAFAKIFKERSTLFAIQNVSSGSRPNYGNWRTWGRYSWSLGDVSHPDNGHQKLHLYEENDNELSISTNSDKPRNFHIKVNGYLDQSSKPSLGNSDFVISLDLNNIFKRGFEKVTSIRDSRNKSKEGATKLMSDSKIKRMNLDRYFDKILNKMGIRKDASFKDLNNLQKIINIVTCGDLVFYSVFYSVYNNNTSDYIRNISNMIYRLLVEDDKEYHIKSIKDSYKDLKDNSNETQKRFKKSLDLIKLEGSDDVNKLFNETNEISKVMSEYIKSLNIKTLEDLNVFYHKIQFIRNLINDDRLRLTNSSSRLLGNLFYFDDISYYLNNSTLIIDKDIRKDIKKIEVIIRNIKSVLN